LAGETPTNEHHVLVGVVDVDVDALETGVVDQAAPHGVREDAEEVGVVLDTQRLSRSGNAIAKSTLFAGARRHNVAAAGRLSAAVAMATLARRATLCRHLARRVIRTRVAHQRRTSGRGPSNETFVVK